MLDETGCAGVSIGRGAFYNPWIFQHTLQYLGRAGSPLPAAGGASVLASRVERLVSSLAPPKDNGAHGVTRPTENGKLPPEPTFCRPGAGDVPAPGFDD